MVESDVLVFRFLSDMKFCNFPKHFSKTGDGQGFIKIVKVMFQPVDR